MNVSSHSSRPCNDVPVAAREQGAGDARAGDAVRGSSTDIDISDVDATAKRTRLWM
jgi:hypothetical protein